MYEIKLFPGPSLFAQKSDFPKQSFGVTVFFALDYKKAYLISSKGRFFAYCDEETLKDSMHSLNTSEFGVYFQKKTGSKLVCSESYKIGHITEDDKILKRFIKKMEKTPIVQEKFHSINFHCQKDLISKRFKKYKRRVDVFISVFLCLEELKSRIFEKRLLQLIETFVLIRPLKID